MKCLHIYTTDSQCLGTTKFQHLCDPLVLTKFIHAHRRPVYHNRNDTNTLQQNNVLHQFLFFHTGKPLSAIIFYDNDLVYKISDIRQCITKYCRFMFNVFQITIHNYTSSALNKKPARKLLQASNSERGIRTLDTAGMNRML